MVGGFALLLSTFIGLKGSRILNVCLEASKEAHDFICKISKLGSIKIKILSVRNFVATLKKALVNEIVLGFVPASA